MTLSCFRYKARINASVTNSSVCGVTKKGLEKRNTVEFHIVLSSMHQVKLMYLKAS